VSGSDATPITTESAAAPLLVLLPGAEQAATPVSIAAVAAAVRIRRAVMDLTPLMMSSSYCISFAIRVTRAGQRTIRYQQVPLKPPPDQATRERKASMTQPANGPDLTGVSDEDRWS